MAELFTALAVLLMVLAVAGSVTPMAPGALLSVAGIIVYWYGTGFSRPETWFLATFIATGLFAFATDYLAGTVTAKMGGASTRTALSAGIVGLLMFFVLGPIGILVGVAGGVLVREYLRTGDATESTKAAFYSAVGVMGSTLVQVAVTLSLLVAFIAALIV